MEALQLQDAAFVRERFQQLQQAEAEQPTPHRKKKLAVLEAILTRLCATSEADAAMTLRRQDARDANAPVPLKELPLPTQVALRMFFRTCQSLRDPARLASNCRLAVQLASRLPGLLTAMPSCVLSPGLVEDAPTGAETDGSLWSVFYQLFQLLEELVAGESVTLSAGDRATVVVAYVALSLKWGRLRDLLKGVKLLLESGDDIEPARFEPIMPLLRELAAASAERPQMASEEQPCGFLMSFGKGDHGKLGHGQCSHVSCQEGNCTENKTVPTMIVATRDVLFRKIDSLSTHSIAITAKGEAMAWGNGDKYRLGHGSSSKEYTPRTIEFLSLKGRVRDLACGLGHTLALMESGELFAWGNGSNGRLGLGDTNDRSSPTRVLMPILSGKQEGESTIDPVSLKGAPVRFRHVFCGASHSLGISWEGRAYAWGKNNQGQCGHGHTNDQWTVQEIESFSDNEEGEEDECIIYAAGGWEHTLFCADSGRVYSCGCGYKDSRRAGIPPVLGHGDCERRLKPTLIQALNDAREEIVRVACGWDHSLAVSASGKVYTWGSGTNGKLGHGDEESFDIPMLVRSMEGKRVKDAKAGCEHTAFLTADHELWTCGQGDSGRLGHGDNQTRKRPTKVELFTECGLKPVALAVGDKYNLVLVTDGDNHYDYERESGENTFRNRAHQVNYHSSKQVSIDASGKGYHGHPRKLLHKKPINSHQEKFGANWTLNIAMGLTPNAATASTNALKKDGFTPDSASAVALYIIGHLDRLASAYITDAFDAQLEKRHDLKSPETRPNAQSVLLPFAVDTSCESLYALLQLLRWTTSSAGIEEKGLRIEMSGLDTMSWTFQNRLAVVLSCLRVLQLNLKKSLDVATLNLGGIDSSSKFFNSMDLIGEMHGFLDSIANLKGEGIVNYFGTGARRLECADNSVDIGNAVSYEAACALKMGFGLFYPTDTARCSLLWEVLDDCKGDTPSMRTAILSDQLCKDSIMTEIFRYLPSHGLPNLESGVAEEMRQNSFGNDIFEIKSLMITLLRRSSTEAIKHLENEALTDFTIEPDCFLRLLHVLQTHYFSIVYRVASQQYRKDPIMDISQQIMDSLLEYVDALMAEALAVLKRLHNASRQHEEIITWRLNGSFFQTVLPNAIECISVILLPATYKETIAKNNTPRTGNFQLVERILPDLHVMLKMLDEVSWKMHSAGDGNNQTHNDVFPSSSGASSVEHNWFVNLSEACAVLCGKLSCELFYPSTVIDELPNADGETYSSLILSEGRLFVKEHDALSVAYAKRSSSVCTILEWERLGVFEVEDELVVSEEEPCTSGSTRPLAVDVHANQRYLLQLCETDFKGKPLSFWSWVASNLSETLEFSTESQRLLTVVVSVLSWHLGLGNELQHAYELYEVAPTDLILTVSCATFPTGKIWGLLRALIDNGKSWSYRSIDANCVANSIKLGHLLLNLQPNPAFVPPVLRNTCSTIDTSKQFVWVDDSLTPLFDFLTKAVDINVMHNILCMKEENGALVRTGICIIHDLLRKLTTSSAKSGLLDELVYATCATNRTSLTQIPLPQQITLKGNNNQQVSKAIENLFIQLARIVSSDDASLELKRKALLAWTVPFSTKESDSSVVALIAKAGIVSSLIELLLEEANVLDTHSDINAFMQTITIGSNAAVTLAEGSSPSQSESSPTTKVAPTDATFFDQTPAQGISMLAWDAFCVISLQLGHSDYFAQHRAVLLLRSSGSSIHDKEPLTPRSTSLSPRRRLTLPKKMIISTVDEIIEEMIDGLFLLLKGVKYRLEALDCLSKQCDTSKVDKSSELVLHISKISSKPISEETIARIHQNGIVLFQLKQYHIASSYCVKILRLLSQLIDGRKQSTDEAERGPMSDRWIVLLHSMLVTTCRDQDLAQVYLCYLLQDVLSRAPPLPAFDTHSLIKSLFSSHTELTKMQVLLNEFSNLSNENSTTSPMKQQQNDALHALMAQHGMLYGRYRYGTSASAISSKTILSLRFAAGVHLFQGLSRTLGWKEQLSQFIVSSISTLLSVRDINDFLQAVESSKLNVVATLGNVVAGYSEESLNGHRALGRDSALFPAGIRTCNAPFESVARFDENNADQTSTLHALIAALLKEEVRQKLRFPARKDIVVKCQNDIIAVNAVDERIRTVLHLRACAFRVLVASLLREQCEKTSRIWHRFLLENTEACDDLLQTASLYTREHVMTGLGYDAKAAMKLRRVRIFMKEILRGRKHRRGVLSTTSLAELENLQWQLWEEMAARHPAAELIPWWQQNSEVNGKVALEIVGGDVELCDLKVTALEHFPTVRLAQTNICANSGMWFYEVVVLTDGLMQVGYVDGDFIADPMQGQGVGDHTNSWAFDGFRCKKWNVNSYDYGEQWKAGDVVGVLLDTDRMEISYLLNGKFLGVAFSGLPVTASSRLCPAASLNVHQSAEFNFGTSSALSPSDGAIQSSNIGGFKHLPIQDSQDQARLRPVIMALAGRCAPNEDNGLNLDCQNAETKLNEASEDLVSSSSSDSDTDDAAIAFEGTTSLPGFSTAVDSSSLEGHDTRVTDQSDEEHIQRRRDLVEGLTGLGFPIDWATRCATETRLPMDETGAVAWILGQMEKVGLDGVSSLPSTLDDDSTLGQTSARVQLPNLVVSHSADYLDTESSAVAASETTKHLKRTDDNEIARAADIYNSRDSAASVFRPQDCGVLERQNVSSTATNSFLDSDKSDKQIDDALWEPFQSSPYCQRENDNNATFLLLDATNTSAFGDSNRGVDDLPPLSASVDIALFVGYTRQAFTSLLLLALDKDEREAIYKMVQRIAVNDTSCSRFYQFLRLAIGLDAMDFSFEIGYMSDGICPERSLQLQKALAALLRYEVELISPEHSTSENPPETSPLLKSLCKEMQRQCDRGLAFARLKQTNKNGSELSVMQTSAAWFAWVSGLVLRLVEAEISPKLFKPHFRFAVPAFQNTAFVENLVALASSSSSIFIAWKYVAIRLISRILAAMKANDDAKSNDISCVQSSGNPCASLPAFYATAQLANLAEFFTLRRRREMHSRAFFSDITCTLFPLLVHSCAPFDHISNLIELRLRGAQGVNLRVNSYSSTHITISWDQGSPTALLMQTRTSSPEDLASDTITAEAESDHPILFLKITRYGPTFHGSVIPDNSDSTLATKALPSKGTYTIRNLLPDTQYLLQLAPLQPMDDGATSGLALNDVATPGYSTTACCTELVVQTLPEPVFQLDKESSGKNLVVFNQNLSARNTVNKKWHSVRASVAFDEGVHQWHVRLDTCVSKNIFIGVCTAEASMENYIGSDGFGYGFLANKAVWHNKAKLHSYGEIFKQGDLIQVTLDCNAKTLAFSRNGEYLGIAATNMRAGTSRTGIGSNTSSEGSCKWYPAFSMYNKDDKLTLIPPPAISIFSSKDGRSQNASTFNLIEAMKDVLAYESNVTSVDFSSDNTSTKLFEKAFREFERWRRDEVIYREIAVGHIIAINKSRIATDKYGLATGDSVFTSKGQCCVLGEYRHELWYEVDQGGGSSLFGTSVSQLASWSLSACREMLSSPDEYPVHRHHQYKLERENQTVETEDSAVKQQDPSADTLDNSFHSFVDAQKQWSNNANAAEADTTLIAELNVIRSSSQSSNTSQMLSFADVSVALLIEKLNEVHGISTKCDSNQTLARIGLLLHVNRCLYNIVRFTLPRNILATSLRACGRPKSSINQHDLGEQAPNEANSECYQVSPVAALLNSPYWALDDPSAFSQLPVLAARLLFSSQKNKLIDEELQRTKTAIQNSDSSFQEPSDNEDGGIDTGILPIKISYPLSPAVPFWKLKSISLKSRCCRLPASREGLVFVQLAKQLSAQDAHQWRRESSLPFEAIPISQTFQVIVEKLPVVLSEDSTGIELDQQQQEKDDDDQESSSKQTANYLTLFESAVREVQSPCFPLFVPIQTSCVDDGPIQLVLDVNMELFSPSALAHSGVKSSQVMSWFFCFGQLLGMAWRSKLLLPLQFLSKAFWSELVNPTVDDLEATAQSRYQTMAISAIRDGLFSIIPSRCVALLSGSNPSLRERLSDLDVSYVDRLERHAVYVGPRQSHHDLFWRVVSAFTSVERRMLEQFVNPERRSVAKQVEVMASRADASSIFVLEIADALADGRDHPDSCYPVVVPMSPHSSRLHLPAYSSALTLRHKLLLAMTNIPFM